eukprot:134776-Hanusia_phi.AAC.2
MRRTKGGRSRIQQGEGRGSGKRDRARGKENSARVVGGRFNSEEKERNREQNNLSSALALARVANVSQKSSSSDISSPSPSCSFGCPEETWQITSQPISPRTRAAATGKTSQHSSRSHLKPSPRLPTCSSAVKCALQTSLGRRTGSQQAS